MRMGQTSESQSAATDTVLAVYVVESSYRIRERLVEAISGDPRVRVVATGETAQEVISRLHRLDVDVLILELRLREGSGFDVLRFLATAARRPRVIVLTAFAQPCFRHACMRLGADHFFDKARDYDRVPIVLKEWCEGC